MRYEAFISYSHAADASTAVALRRDLESFGRPLFRARALRVWRDSASLEMTAELLAGLHQALDDSKYLPVLLSPEAARSTWIQDEIEYFVGRRSPRDLGLVPTHGKTPWTDPGCMPGDDQCAVSPQLHALVTRGGDVPRVIDLRPFVRVDGRLRRRDRRLARAS